MTSKARVLARAAFVLAAAAVAVGSLTPAAEMPAIEVSDKVQHFGAYAGLAFLAVLAWPQARLMTGPVMSVILAGPAIELLQLLVPGRSASLADAAADLAGVAVGWVLASWLQRRFPR